VHQAAFVPLPVQVSFESMCSTMTAADDGMLSRSRPHDEEEEELIINVTAWQLPPDGELSCDIMATPPRKTRSGTDDCHFLMCPTSPRECDMVPPNADEIHCAARCRASTWPGCAVQASLLRADSEGEIKSQSPSRPFLSLMLPEWVHEKAAEDEAAGTFPSRSAMSSLLSSPAGSRASSPQVPSRAESRTASARRSGVNWADLSDEEDDGLVSYAWSTISTATSSPAALSRGIADRDQKEEKAVEIVILGETFKSPQAASIGVEYQLASPQTLQASVGPCGQPHVYSKAAGHSAIRWVDLVESDIDPVDYAWSHDASVLWDASLIHEPIAEPMGFESGRTEYSSARDDDLDSGPFHACVASAPAKAGAMKIILESSI